MMDAEAVWEKIFEVEVLDVLYFVLQHFGAERSLSEEETQCVFLQTEVSDRFRRLRRFFSRVHEDKHLQLSRTMSAAMEIVNIYFYSIWIAVCEQPRPVRVLRQLISSQLTWLFPALAMIFS